jgi:enterochelin esterase-like enzyme
MAGTFWGVYAISVARRSAPGSAAVALLAAIADVEAGRQQTPLIGSTATGGDTTVTFLARRDHDRMPRIVSDVTGWGEHIDGTFDFNAGAMTPVAGTDWYLFRTTVAPRARVEYLIAYGQNDYRLDPHNPRRVSSPPASELAMPGYVPPRELTEPPVLQGGCLAESTIKSRALGGPRRVVVYTPSGYRNDRRYPVAVFVDPRASQVSRVLDWLIAHQSIEPLVGVFVEATPPGGDIPMPAALRAFVVDDVLSWLSSRYAVTKNADERAIIAISYGAKDALHAALHSPSAFGRLGLLIPGRRIGRDDVDAIAQRRSHRLQVAILAGRYDRANLATARSVRQALADAGDTVTYTEVPEGHSPRTWLNNLHVVLLGLFGAKD